MRAPQLISMYYDGMIRQRGAGLGDVFRVLARTVMPQVLRLGKNFVRQKVSTLGPKALKAGVGVVKDVIGKRTLKQAIRQRGKRLLSEAINSVVEPNKRQKTARPRASKKSSGATKTKGRKKRPLPRNRDIFD